MAHSKIGLARNCCEELGKIFESYPTHVTRLEDLPKLISTASLRMTYTGLRLSLELFRGWFIQ